MTDHSPPSAESAKPAATAQSLTGDLAALGVEPGDLLFVHASYKSIGNVEGGAGAVVDALKAAIGDQGTLLMPSFNLISPRESRADNWDISTTPATTGWLTEFFRQLDDTTRSDHYSHSVSACGRGAAEILSDHRSIEGMRSPWDIQPWGRTFGEQSPMQKAMTSPRGKLLMLGAPMSSSTYCHVAEVIDWNRRLAANPDAKYFWLNRPAIGQWWLSQNRCASGKVGRADSHLMPIGEYVDTMAEQIRLHPDKWTVCYD